MPTSTAGNSSRKPAPSRQAGFTLIELGVVVLLISMFTLISIPLFSRTGLGNLEASARRVSGTIKYLFNEAALTGLEHRLVCNLDRSVCRAQVLEADGRLVDAGRPGKQLALSNGIRFADLTLPSRGSYRYGEVTIRFDPAGWVEETIVYLADSGDDILTLRINPLTGSTEIFEGRREFQKE